MAPVLLQFQSREGGASRTWHPGKRDTGEENTFNSQEIRDYSVLQLYRANQPPVPKSRGCSLPFLQPCTHLPATREALFSAKSNQLGL